tara:strand:+ start:1579 stop:2292 length:714 start_codon:yes stop_codon:yes gene_type:complete
MNKLFDNNISLERETHTYKLKSNPDLQFISATTFVSQFFEKFEAEKIASRLAGTLKYQNMTKDDILKQWEDSANHGTKVHEEIENYILSNAQVSEAKALQGINWLKKYALKSNFSIYPEVMIYSEELKISGTVDLLLYDKNSKKYIIMDWKTSKKIPIKSYKNKMGIHAAASNIEDSKFNHYALQLSLYRYILETYYNLDVSEHLIVHLTDDSCAGLHSQYMKHHIVKMLQSYGDQK